MANNSDRIPASCALSICTSSSLPFLCLLPFLYSRVIAPRYSAIHPFHSHTLFLRKQNSSFLVVYVRGDIDGMRVSTSESRCKRCRTREHHCTVEDYGMHQCAPTISHSSFFSSTSFSCVRSYVLGKLRQLNIIGTPQTSP
jgi:hypothetical protein